MTNIIVLQGRLTTQPELKTTQSGTAYMKFCVAVERDYQAKGEDRQTDFVDCLAWTKTAEFIEKYFDKGSMILLTGTLQTSNFTDKNGNKRKSVDVNVATVNFCGEKKTANKDIETDDDDDFMPF